MEKIRNEKVPPLVFSTKRMLLLGIMILHTVLHAQLIDIRSFGCFAGGAFLNTKNIQAAIDSGFYSPRNIHDGDNPALR
jgi:hypothetical protein